MTTNSNIRNQTNAADAGELTNAELEGIVGGAVRNTDIDLITATFALPPPSGLNYMVGTCPR
jgi:hypothetical protein